MARRRAKGRATSTKSALSATSRSESSSTTTTTPTTSSLSTALASLEHAPALIVFDLDNTLWTPELYQIRQGNSPVAGRDISLFPGALEILQFLADCQSNEGNANPHPLKNTKLAIASRTSKGAWAEQLLMEFFVCLSSDDVTLSPIRDLFHHVEIYTGSKKKHFAALKNAAGCTYSDMLFFDDDARLNLNEVSQLGVLCCHTATGITVPQFEQSLLKYSELRTGHDEGHWMGHVLNDSNLNLPTSKSESKKSQSSAGQTVAGRVKFYSAQKKFGFITDTASGEEYFVHESKVPAGINIQTGDSVVFETGVDNQGRNSAVVVSMGDNASADGSKGSGAEIVGEQEGMVKMPCFTMSQPFAALLINGIKTVESRKNPMFLDVPAGSKVLLHCGRKDWPDQESYLGILSEAGYSASDIEKAGRLPGRFSKGNIIGVMTVGKTWKVTDQERKGGDLQRRVLAPYEAVGKYCTEIVDAQWLKRPVKARGNPGVIEVDIPMDCLPE
jgi:magnesium-dependent phosphatase 1